MNTPIKKEICSANNFSCARKPLSLKDIDFTTVKDEFEHNTDIGRKGNFSRYPK
jgi:hypothetical protein